MSKPSMFQDATVSAVGAVTDVITKYWDEIQAHDAYFGPCELAYLILETIDVDHSRHSVSVPRSHKIWQKWYRDWLRAHDLTAPSVQDMKDRLAHHPELFDAIQDG